MSPSRADNDRSGAPIAPAAADAWFSPKRFATILALFLVGAFPKIVFGLHTFFYRDFGVLAYPSIFYHHQSFWRGELPLWNPLSNCGAPFLAQWGTMVLYPFSLFYLLLPLPWSVNFFGLAHLFWAGLGMYFLATRWIENRFAASLGGIAFVFNGVTLSCLLWPNYLVALGWMPWVILWAERAMREGGRSTVAAALIATMQMLSGVPEIVLLTWLLIVCLWIEAVARKSVPPDRLIARTVPIVVLASGLMAAQLLPFLDLLAHSQRDPGFATSKWAMPIWGWANLLVPLFRSVLTAPGIFFQFGQEFLSSTYLGAAIVGLSLVAVCSVRQPRVWLLGGLAVFSLMMAWGENGFLYGALRRLLPLLGFARYPIKFTLLTAFVLPLLAAYAVGAMQDRSTALRTNPRRRLLFAGAVCLTAMGFVLWAAHRYPLPYDQWPAIWQNTIWRSVFLASILGLLVLAGSERVNKTSLIGWSRILVLTLIGLDALTHVPQQNPTLPSSALAPGLWEMSNKVPPPQIGQGRVLISPRAEHHLLWSRVPSLFDDLLGKRLALWSHLNLLEGIPKVNGSSTLQLCEQAQVQSLLYASTNTDLPSLADFLGASRTTAAGQIIEWADRPTSLPWVTAGQKPIFAGSTNTLSALTNAAFNPSREVYLPPEAKASVTATGKMKATITPRSIEAHRIALEIDAQEASLVVVAQSFYHPWHAYVDGVATQIWRANHAFQAFEVKAGRRQVELKYEDRRFQIGALISGLTLLICGWWWFRGSSATPTENSV